MPVNTYNVARPARYIRPSAEITCTARRQASYNAGVIGGLGHCWYGVNMKWFALSLRLTQATDLRQRPH
jgi:hypothetical protein